MGHLTKNVSAAWLIGLKICDFSRRAVICLSFFVLILESGVMCFEEIDN